jgi:hypothetical protein
MQLKDVFIPAIEIFVTDDNDGLLDNMAQPLLPLNDPIPGLSDLTGKEITILDVGELYPKAAKGVAAVRGFLEAYEKIKSFVDDFSDNGIITLADACYPLEGFRCEGALFGDADAAERQLVIVDDAAAIFGTADRAGLPMTPSSGLGRFLQVGCPTTKPLFDSYLSKLPDPTNCTAVPCECQQNKVKRVKCLALRVKCKVNSIDGLSFPFLADPKLMIGLISGEDFVSCQGMIGC